MAFLRFYCCGFPQVVDNSERIQSQALLFTREPHDSSSGRQVLMYFFRHRRLIGPLLPNIRTMLRALL